MEVKKNLKALAVLPYINHGNELDLTITGIIRIPVEYPGHAVIPLSLPPVSDTNSNSKVEAN